MYQYRSVTRKWVLIVLLVGGLCETGLAGLAARIGKIVETQAGGDFSIQVVEPDSGATVYSYNARKPLIPASNMKLITTAAALKYLGPDFEYRTQVALSGDTLVVLGSGDPLLGDKYTDDRYGRESGWVFARIVQALRVRAVAEINDIVIDTTVFDDQRVHPSWPARDYNRWYACEVCGLNYNGNCIDVTTTNVGGSVVVETDPATRFIEAVNQVEAVSSGDEAVGSYRTQQPNRIIIFGKCRTRQGPFRVAIEQPAGFFGFLLSEQLQKAGITAKGKVIEKPVGADAGLKPLVEFCTPIADVIGRANTDSLGLAAEALIKTIDAHNNPDKKLGGWPCGRESVRRYLAGLGIPSAEIALDDGSGLSRENRLTTNAITKVFLDLYKSRNWGLFEASLAVGGEEGTIDKYFGETKYRGNVLGKTGYISGVRAFSGVCKTQSGPYIFSVLSNGSKGLSRDAINDVAKAIIDEFGSQAKAK
ncbi:MAG: D-alanyl-D-alanine carboxypeptidase/D-alanyl-D-alanine-endopeptidase [Sedimentisphaerales bacterium]|nr:D-alanyl-D-alanine carboxypeptidase/D-alanyl-D-alanine-endopeptidase [Sedimentisphaerales bacterium]